MAYCAPQGIPYLHFLGGPAGWTQLDRDAALAWQRYDRERCPNCGTHPSLWDEKCGGDEHALAPTPVHCRGCEVKAGGDDRFEKTKSQYRRGTTMQLRVPEQVIEIDVRR